MAKKKQTEKRETATVNLRILRSTRDAINEESRKTGKTMVRLVDEKFNPQKYQQ